MNKLQQKLIEVIRKCGFIDVNEAMAKKIASEVIYYMQGLSTFDFVRMQRTPAEETPKGQTHIESMKDVPYQRSVIGTKNPLG